MGTANVLEKFWGTISLSLLQRIAARAMEVTNHTHNARVRLLVDFTAWKKPKIGQGPLMLLIPYGLAEIEVV